MKATQHAESVGMLGVGYYQACKRLDDTALAPVGEKVAGKVKAAFEDAVAFVVTYPSFLFIHPVFSFWMVHILILLSLSNSRASPQRQPQTAGAPHQPIFKHSPQAPSSSSATLRRRRRQCESYRSRISIPRLEILMDHLEDVTIGELFFFCVYEYEWFYLLDIFDRLVERLDPFAIRYCQCR